MAVPQLYNLVRVATATTGAGTVTLGAVIPGYRTFADAGVPTGTTVRYGIVDPGVSPTAREVGYGVYTASGTTLTRNLVDSTTGSLLNLSGSAQVYIVAASADFPQSAGISARDTDGAWHVRTITAATDGGVGVTNGSGAAGNPTISTNNYATRTALAAATVPSDMTYVRTAGYSAAGDGGGALYKRVGSEPAHAGKVQSADGAWWELDLSSGVIDAACFGAVGDGVTDDAAALNSGLAALASVGGGGLDLSGGRYLVNSADLAVGQGVSLCGPYRNFGEITSDNYASVKGCIVLNPSYTIRLRKFSSVTGIIILKTGLTTPTNLRTAVDLVASFSGIAITIGDGPGQSVGNIASDVYIGHTFIVGFATAIYNYRNERPHVEYVSGDCTNGVHFNYVPDMDHVEHCHFWPFAVAHISGGGPATYAVSGTADNGGGLIRVSLAANVIQAGDTVVVGGVGGTTEANGRWTVAAVGSGYIDLASSAYANAYTSGGNVYLNPYKRAGTSYKFENLVDWGQASDCFSYGYDYGFVVDACNDVVLVNCGVDAWASESDPTIVGYQWQNGSLKGTIIGCKCAGHGYGVVQNVGAGSNSSSSADLTIQGSHFWGNNQGHIHVVTGRAKLIGNHFDSLSGPVASTAYAITVEGASYGVVAIGNSCTLSYPIQFTAGGNALYMSTVRQNRWSDPSTTGNREIYDNSQRSMYFGTRGSASGLLSIYQNARGSAVTPTATQDGDTTFTFKGQSYDGTTFTDSAAIRNTSDGGASSGSTPGKLIFSTTANAAASVTDRVVINRDGSFYPATDNAYSCGANGARWSAVWAANGTIQTSDEREKLDITPSTLGLDFVNSLRPVSYRWRSGGNEVIRQAWIDTEGNEIPEGEPIPDDATPGRIITREKPGNRRHWGLIAQEVKAVCDNAGVDFGGWVLSDASDPKSQQALRYDQFVAPLIKAVQELAAEVKDLKAK